MAAVSRDKWRKNAFVLYDDNGHDELFRIYYDTSGVNMAFDSKEPAPIIMEGAHLNLAHNTYPVPDVGKAIHNLQHDVASNTEERVTADNNLIPLLNTLETGIASQIDRAMLNEAETERNIAAEKTRAMTAENANANALAVLEADQKIKHDAIEAWQIESTELRVAEDSQLDDVVQLMIQFATENDAAIVFSLNEEISRAIASEQELKTELTAYKNSNDALISDINTQIINLINSTNSGVLASIQNIIDTLNNSDSQFAEELVYVLTQVSTEYTHREKFLNDLADRIAYLEGVIIETFDGDRTGDNDTSYEVECNRGSLGDGKQSGWYRKTRNMFINLLNIVEEGGSRPSYTRSDGKYCMLFDATPGNWVLAFGNAPISVGRGLPKFNFGGGNGDAPISNLANGCIIREAKYGEEPSSTLVGEMYADDRLYITVNDKVVYYSSKRWNKGHNFELEDIKNNDSVKFHVKNTGGPGGLIGFFDCYRVRYHVHADTGVFENHPDDIYSDTRNRWRGVGNKYKPESQWTWNVANTREYVFEWKAKVGF